MLTHPAKPWLIGIDFFTTGGYSDGSHVSADRHVIVLLDAQHYVVDPAHPRRTIDDCVKHRLDIRRRAADDAQNLGSRRLMLKRLTQFRITFLQFFEQPHVLDRDHCLSGKGFYKRNLLIDKRTDLVASKMDRSNSVCFAKQRHY